MQENEKINCETYQKEEIAIKRLTEQINSAKEVSAKAKYAEELIKKTEELLACLRYDEKQVDCGNCRFITNLRMRTARLIMKVKKLK